MLLLARLVIVAVSGLIWNTTRQVDWLRRNIPWMKVLSFWIAVLTLISLILEIVIRVKTLRN